MPQLDVTSFTSQILWLVAIYFIFYILLLKYILPRLGRILKFRKNYKMAKTLKGYSQESHRLSQTINDQLSGLVQRNLSLIGKNHTLLETHSSSENQLAVLGDSLSPYRKNLESLFIKKQLLEKRQYEKNN